MLSWVEYCYWLFARCWSDAVMLKKHSRAHFFRLQDLSFRLLDHSPRAFGSSQKNSLHSVTDTLYFMLSVPRWIYVELKDRSLRRLKLLFAVFHSMSFVPLCSKREHGNESTLFFARRWNIGNNLLNQIKLLSSSAAAPQYVLNFRGSNPRLDAEGVNGMENGKGHPFSQPTRVSRGAS